MFFILICLWSWSNFINQGSTNGIRRVCMYAYFHWHIHDFGHEYVDTYAHLSQMVFQSFQNFSSFIILYCLKTYCYDLFVSPWRDRFFTVLKKPYFSVFHTNYLINISPYLRALANLGCQKENELMWCA